MKKMGATVSQANQTNNPDITGAPTLRNSHVPSLLVQATSCIFAAVLQNISELGE
jgi:hypothetical protein